MGRRGASDWREGGSPSPLTSEAVIVQVSGVPSRSHKHGHRREDVFKEGRAPEQTGASGLHGRKSISETRAVQMAPDPLRGATCAKPSG